jgi:hypothetical protein
MKSLIPGHRYMLANFDDPTKEGQHLQFIEKVPVTDGTGIDGQLVTLRDGTTNEEVLAVLSGLD